MTNATMGAIRGNFLKGCIDERLYASDQWNRAEELPTLREQFTEIFEEGGQLNTAKPLGLMAIWQLDRRSMSV
jgi:hypothetical protein